MSISSIIASANSIIADANSLPTTGPAWPATHNCLGGTHATSTAFTAYDFWSSMVVYHGRMQTQLRAGYIACLGNSTTQGMDVTQIHPACVNFGIGGDTIAGLLNRLDSLTGLTRAGAIILEIGSNDEGATVFQTISDNFDKLFAWLTGPLVVWSMDPQINCSVATTDAVNAMMATKLAGRAKCVLADVTTPMRGADGWLNTTLSIGDRIHPNAAGYAVLRPIITAALATVLA